MIVDRIKYAFTGSTQRLFSWVSAHPVLSLVGVGLAFVVGIAIVAWIVEWTGNLLGARVAGWLSDFPFLIALPFLMFPPTVLFGGFLLVSGIVAKFKS